jgi:hypothetical protein
MELPAQFAERINKLDSLITKYEAAISDDEKESSLRLALVISCELLSSIDMDLLRTTLQGKFNEANETVPRWRDIIIGEDGHFEFFLNKLEDEIFKAAGINENTRNRIRKNLETARAVAGSMQPDVIVRAIEHLRDDVCLEARIKVAVDRDRTDTKARNNWYWTTSKKVVKVVAAGAVVVNALSLVVSLGLSAPGSAASASLGGAAQFL